MEPESLILIFGILVWVSFGLVLLIFLFRFFSQKEREITQALNLVFLKINKKFLENPQFSESFYDFLHSLKVRGKKPYLVFEMLKIDSNIEFYLALERKEKEIILKNFSKFFPDFQIFEAEPFNIFDRGERATGFELSLEKFYFLPIKTYKLANSLFEKIFDIFQLSRGKVALQILIKPTRYSLKDQILRMSKNERREFLKSAFLGLFQQKVKKRLFEVSIRFLSPGETSIESNLHLAPLKRLFELEKNQDKVYNSFKIKEVENLNEFIFKFIFRIFDSASKIILNSEEIATVFYL